MDNIKKKDEVQQRALKAWEENNKTGTVEIITGLGKTFIGLHALYTMPKDPTIEHWFLAEVVDRKKDLIEDIKKYNKIFNRDVLNDYNLKFHCYQSVYKWENKKIGLIIADEIHDSLTPSYSKFYHNNNYNAIIGLSALVDIDTYYEETRRTKGYYLNEVAPICFKYHINDGLKDGTARNLDIYIIKHKLDSTNKVIKSGSPKKYFMQTEQKAYKYWDDRFNKALIKEINLDQKPTENPTEYYNRLMKEQKAKDLNIQISVGKRSKLLYDLPSKIEVVKKLIKHIKGKTIVFGNSIDALLKVTPNVVSSRNSDKINNLIRHNFDTNKTRLIGSFKKLKQGANLTDLDACVIMSYYSKEKDLIQRLGRLRDNGQIGKVFIIVTENTQEETWLKNMFKNVQNYNFIFCENVDSCIKKL